MDEKKGMITYALEMATVRHVGIVAQSFLELLKDLKGYNSLTETPSYLTVPPSTNERSFLNQLIDILDKCVIKRGERGFDAFESHYFQIIKEKNKYE